MKHGAGISNITKFRALGKEIVVVDTKYSTTAASKN